jgi:uncharacterized protein (DUF608 family)
MRNRFEQQLFELNREIIEMGALCEEAIEAAAKALIDGDVILAETVKENGSAIDQMLGQWHANLLGLGDIFSKEMIRQAIKTMYERNVKLNNMVIMNDETTPEGDFDGYGYTFV